MKQQETIADTFISLSGLFGFLSAGWFLFASRKFLIFIPIAIIFSIITIWFVNRTTPKKSDLLALIAFTVACCSGIIYWFFFEFFKDFHL
jgi:hypothetical protein